MSLDEGLAKFLGGLYEAVHHPEAWRFAMAEVARRTGSRLIVATSIDLRSMNVADIQYHGLEDSSVETGAREYVNGMSEVDPVLEWMQRHPGGGKCQSAGVMTEAGYHDHEIVKWSRSRFGTAHWSVFYSQPADDLSFATTFFAPADAGPVSKPALALQELLFENMERAVRLAVRPPEFAADDSALVAIDATGRPLSLSRRAEELLAEGGELTVRGGRLTTKSPTTANLLQRAVHAAINPVQGRMERSIRIARTSGKPDLFVIVSPFPPSLDHVPRRVPAALVRLVEVDRRAQHLSEHSHLFDFSRREIHIASALLEGHSIESLAAMLGISRNTVRNHVQALFRKTGTNRQADLVRMLDRVARH